MKGVLAAHGIDVLIPIGGEGTLTAAYLLSRSGVPVVGIGKEVRTTVLGHVQRGGTPTSFDRVLATRFGLHATIAAREGAHGQMVALRGNEIELVPLEKAVATLKTVTPTRLAETGAFTG